ncbi:hypothetical protein QJQ45_014816 [Haematococcus lacustris]|nr:hypothetical protein QJQ45_014816 [Haematococcus lacustris]
MSGALHIGNGDALLSPTASLARRTTSQHVVNSVAGKGQADAYLSELLGYSLDRLRKEPELLQEERSRVERSLQGAAVTQYPAFIQTASCLDTISAELTSICEDLDFLLEGIPQLASACEGFAATASEVQEQHAQNKHLAGSQAALVELLEVPQLMDSCVRNGVYDEALDLQAFVTRLGLLHAEVPLVRLLMEQVSAVGHTMLQQLLARLRSSIQLPECLRVMGYLRRIAVFTEAELRLHFLQCRDEWLSSLVVELDESDSYELVKHLTDIHRLHLFDAVMQYRAIFFDTTATASTASAGPGLANNSLPVATAPGEARQLAASLREGGLLHSWLQQRLAAYRDALSRHLPAITEGGQLASALEHCMYCGSSLSRVGLDFQGLLQPLFESCTLGLLTQHLAAAVELFNARLESHKWVAMPTPMQSAHKGRASDRTPPASTLPAPSPSSPPTANTAGSGAAAGGLGGLGGPGSLGVVGVVGPGATVRGVAGEVVGEVDLSPPYSLMEHLPLAVFTNGLLTALNELRHCALLGVARPAARLRAPLKLLLPHLADSWLSVACRLAPAIAVPAKLLRVAQSLLHAARLLLGCRSVTQQAVAHVAAGLMHYRYTHHLNDSELDVFRAALQCALDTMLPFLAACFARIFAPAGSTVKLDTTGAAAVLRSVLQEP